jgi:subtilisin family serine protease
MKMITTIGLLAVTASPAFAAEYIVKLKNSDTSTLKNLKSVRTLNLSFGNFAVIESDQKLADLKSLANIEYIEPNFTYKAFTAPTDANFSKQWGLNNDGKNSGSIWSPGKKGIDISALEAWKITKGNRSVKIAVIDTGVDYNHPDLSKNIMVNDAELNGTDGVDDDNNGYIDDVYGYDFGNNDNDPMDGHGHGTHCAGVIGASHDAQGIAGVMANVQILPIKFLKDNGSGTLEGAIGAIDYAISRGVDIMSNSWGGPGNSQALKEAIIRARDAGITFIAAAGNSNADNDSTMTLPAGYDLENIISVGALDGKGKKAGFSNYGKTSVHVFAPGVDIYSTVQNGGYKKMSGTSMACPHVAGVAGLILSSEPNMSYVDIRARLMATSIKTSDLSIYTASGYVDAALSLK